MKRYSIIIALAAAAALHSTRPCSSQDAPVKPLSLAESIQIALEKNADVRAADHAVTGADYERKAARADFLPKISTEHSFIRYDETPYEKSPAGEFGPSAMRYKAGTRGRFQWSTSVTQPIFAGGAIASSYRIAKFGSDLARAGRVRARQEIILQVKEAYFNILKTEKIKAVADQAVEQVQSHVEVAKAMFEEEMVPQNDFLQAEVRFAQTKQDRIRAENAAQVAKACFNTVLSRDINEPTAVEDILICEPDNASLGDALKQAMSNRPEMKEAGLAVQRADQAVGLAKSSYFPSLCLVGMFQKAGEDGDMSSSPYEDEQVWSVATVLRWDVWEWGRSYYKVGSSRSQLREAQEHQRKVADSVSLEVKESYLNMQAAYKNIAVAQTAVRQAEENFRLYKEQYAEQMATTTDVLDAQTLLTEAKSNYYNALSDYHIARAQLDRAVGAEKDRGPAEGLDRSGHNAHITQ